MGQRLQSCLYGLFHDVNKKVESRQKEKQKEAHDKNPSLQEFNVGDLVLAKDFRATGSKWMPGTVLKVTDHLSHLIKLVNGNTVCRHIDNVI